MLRLPSAAPAWADLAQGVRVLHRPAGSAEVAAAVAWSRAEAAAMAARLPGHTMSEAERTGILWGLATIALGRLCVTDWQGVADAEGNAAPCTPDGVAALLALPEMASAYLPLALSVENAVRDEGNGSAPAPSGTTAGAPNTAEGAAPQA